MIFSAFDINEMHQVGQQIAAQLPIPSIVYLQGDLGAGKTSLTQGIAKYFDYQGVVSSPTYNLIHQYPCEQVNIAHLDLYRLEETEELAMLGIADLISDDQIMLIEWPEKGAGQLPKADFTIEISYLDVPKNGREIILKSNN